MSGLERLYSPPEIGAPGKRQGRRLRRGLLLSGLFVIAMVAVLFGTLTWLKPSLFGESYALSADFYNADGLTAGIPVTLEGYQIGVLRGVEPIFPTPKPDTPCTKAQAADIKGRSSILPCFRATLRIEGRWRIPPDSTIEIGASSPLQGNRISILAGEEGGFLEDNALFRHPGRRNDLLSQVRGLVDSAGRLLEERIEPIIVKVKVMVEEMLEADQSQPDQQVGYGERLTGILDNLDALIKGLKDSIGEEEVSRLITSVEAVSNELQKTTGEIRGLIKENRPSLQRSLDDTRFMMQELAAALTPILTNIEDTTRNLSAISRDLRKDPAVLLKGRRTEEEAPWFSNDRREDQGTPWFTE